jgi:hypothetical protein
MHRNSAGSVRVGGLRGVHWIDKPGVDHGPKGMGERTSPGPVRSVFGAERTSGTLRLQAILSPLYGIRMARPRTFPASRSSMADWKSSSRYFAVCNVTAPRAGW